MLFAQGNGVKVSNFAVSAGTPSTVTFNVSWNRDAMPVAVWSDTVWVFVDYNKNGVMERLPVTGGTATAGTVTKLVGNDQGLRIVGNAREEGVFSATVQLFTSIVNVSGACAYASNYPPVGGYNDDVTAISFTGTPMYEIQLAKSGGGSTTVKSGGTFLLPCDYTVTSFTDVTGAPGIIKEIATPPDAASTKTWVITGNGITQTWSDQINTRDCNISSFTNSTTVPQCRSVTYNNVLYFFYNWSYVNANKDIMCPSPWRVPTANDVMILDLALGGNGQNRTGADKSWMIEKYNNEWGHSHVGVIVPNTTFQYPNHQHIWTSDACGSNAYYLYYSVEELRVNTHVCVTRAEGHGVRCVRNY
jgi:uncharacterized protein (TIGR02145 family)